MDGHPVVRKVLISSPPSESEPTQPPVRIHQLQESLIQLGFNVHIWTGSTVADLLQAVERYTPDIIWSSIYHLRDTQGNEKNCHQIVKEINLPWIGSDPEILDIVLAKDRLKAVWKKNNVSTPNWMVIKQESGFDQSGAWFEYPAIIKPCAEGNSRGLSQESIVTDNASAKTYIEKVLPKFHSVFLEFYLGDDPNLHEYTVAIIGNGSSRQYMPAEIILDSKSGKRIITTADKDQHHTRAIPVEEKRMLARIQEFARQAVEVAGVMDYARLDVLYSCGEFYAIEINGQPMLPDLWFDTCAKSAGLDRKGYVSRIIQSSISRWAAAGFHFNKSSLPISV